MSTTAILENKKNKHFLTSNSVKFYEVWIGWIVRLSSRFLFCRFSSNKQYAKIAIFGIALQFELWYCKNDLNGPLISNFNFETILTCLLFFKVVKVNCEWLLIKQKPYINQPNFVIILGNEKCYPFSHLFKHVNFRLLSWYK
jgi:hypothetical protein